MNRLEEKREAADNVVCAREAEAVKAAETNRGIVAEAHALIHESEMTKRAQRPADFVTGECGTLADLLAAARML